MSDEEIAQGEPGTDEQRRGTLNLRYSEAQASYANIAVLTATREEVIMNFGINAAPPTPDRQVNVEITNRIIMSYPSAKRLAITLGNVVQRYESAHGVIQVAPEGGVGAQAAERQPGTQV